MVAGKPGIACGWPLNVQAQWYFEAFWCSALAAADVERWETAA